MEKIFPSNYVFCCFYLQWIPMFVYAYVHTQLYSVKLIGTVKPSQIHKLSLHVLP